MSDLALVQKQLATPDGIEVARFDEITVASNDLFLYEGFHVLVYIRDQYTRPAAELGYKFHLCSCKTIEEMTRANRFARYVVSTRKDGKFVVNLYDGETRQKVEEGKIVQLNVCKNCLMRLKYDGYSDHRRDSKIYQSFNIEEFFERYQSRFRQTPKDTEKTAPPNEYSTNFEQISYSFRAMNGWQCASCGLFLSEDKDLLDTHHVNRIKSDDSLDNLKALCVRCHAEQPSHNNLKEDPRYRRFILKYGGRR